MGYDIVVRFLVDGSYSITCLRPSLLVYGPYTFMRLPFRQTRMCCLVCRQCISVVPLVGLEPTTNLYITEALGVLLNDAAQVVEQVLRLFRFLFAL